VYTETSGNITSPNYPRPYSNNVNCTYVIRALQPSSFTLTFQRFGLENSDQCTYDWVQVRILRDTEILLLLCLSTSSLLRLSGTRSKLR